MTLDDTPSRDDRLGEALLVCLEAADGGRPIDRESILARYPELSLELADFFASQDRVEPLAAPLRSVALAARLDTSPLALQTPPLGDFRLVREVGRGGMGIVYEAEQISLGRRVALKVLPFAATMDAKQLQRFKNEARAAAGLKHEHIVSVYAVGCERGVHFYSMEFIDGQTLAQIVHDLHAAPPASTVSEAEGKGDVTGPYQPAAPTAPVAALSTERSGPKGRAFYRTAATLIAGAADALEHAHGLGIVHRDVKPANLLVDAAGKVYVGDFGLARTGPDAGLTMTGDLIGTLRYMAPEQAMARHGLADHRVDVYGLGATLYELLTGQPAMAGDDKAEILKAIAFEEPVVPRKIDKGIPAELETIALKCLAKNPTERYATAGELADDLRRFAEDKPIMAKPSGFRERVAKWGRRHKYLVRSAVVVLAVTVVALAVSTVLVLREKVRTEERFQAARAAVDDMYTRVAEDWLDDAPHLTEVQREFLEKALQFYLRFGQDHSDAAAMQNETAQAHIRVGRIQTKLGKLAEAEAAFRQAIDRSETLVAVFPQEPKYRAVLAQAYQFLSTVLEAPAAFPEREQAALRAVELQKRLVVEVPDWPGYWPDLGDSYRLLGRWYEEARRPADAEPQCRQSLDIRERLTSPKSATV
jgi:hypothetical protein